MFAIAGIDAERVTSVIVNGLAVAGAFLAGYILFGVLAWFLDRWLTGGKAPEQLKRASKVVGGLIVAIIVALILFNGGGNGAGGDKAGGGPTPQKAEGDQSGSGPPPITPPVVAPPEKDPLIPPNANAKIVVVGVTIVMGSDEKITGGKYYRLDGKADLFTLDDLFVEIRKEHAPPEKVVQIVPKYLANGGEDTIPAIQLVKRGRLEKIFVETSKSKDKK